MVKYEVVAVVGTYTNRNGEEKKKYKNVGRVIQTDKGFSMVMDRTFNPAGMPGEEDVWLSFFEPKKKEEKQETPDFGDDIPF